MINFDEDGRGGRRFFAKKGIQELFDLELEKDSIVIFYLKINTLTWNHETKFTPLDKTLPRIIELDTVIDIEGLQKVIENAKVFIDTQEQPTSHSGMNLRHAEEEKRTLKLDIEKNIKELQDVIERVKKLEKDRKQLGSLATTTWQKQIDKDIEALNKSGLVLSFKIESLSRKLKPLE